MTNREKIFEIIDMYVDCVKRKDDKELALLMLEIGGITGILRDTSRIIGYNGLWIDTDSLAAWLDENFRPSKRHCTSKGRRRKS